MSLWTPTLSWIAFLIFFILYGIAQEDIVKREFGEKKEKWDFMITLTWITCFANCLISIIVLEFLIKVKNINGSRLTWNHLFAGIVNSFGLMLTNISMEYVSYPAKVLSKSCKPISVIIFTSLLTKKTYSITRWLAVVIITIGIVIFSIDEVEHNETLQKSRRLIITGDLFLLISIFCDGLTSTFQEKIRNKEEKPNFVSCIQLMFLMNAVGMIISFTVTFCIGEFNESIRFIIAYPEILLLLFATVILQAFGQIFLFFNIIMFGTLTTSILQTLRKFITILGAIIIFNDSFDLLKVIGAALVFLGITVHVLGQGFTKKISDSQQIDTERTRKASCESEIIIYS
ncbi:unnamed protein product, partial [Oikopleura dioica]